MGEQTNCNLTPYVKKEANHVGAYFRGKVLYTGDALYVLLLMCPVNSQDEEKLA